MFLKAYSRLCDPELICLKRDIAVCKGQTVECMAVRHFLENGAAKVEVWMGSGQSDSVNAQVTIVDLSEKGVEVQSNEKPANTALSPRSSSQGTFRRLSCREERGETAVFIYLHGDWLKNLALFSQPIRIGAKTNLDLLTGILTDAFSRLIRDVIG